MRKILAAALVLAAISFNASAALVDYDSFTYDSGQNLDWLDLSTTTGMSTATALTANSGWRLAENLEVVNLFAVAFDGYFETNLGYGYSNSNDGYGDQSIDVEAFQGLFGYTTTNISYGFFYDENGKYTLAGTAGSHLGNTTIYSPDYFGSYAGDDVYGNSVVGVYLVRTSQVPVPAAVWLFGSALGGLGWMRRRKTA
jgi:hypothetical protein